LPLVTLPNLGEIAVGSPSNTIHVGSYPTVVIAYNDQPVTVTMGGGACGPQVITQYTGAQSALVVNTGSNNVSLVNIGQYTYPTGTVAVGSAPVAAVINPPGTLAYIANYGSGTISEINLQNVQSTRTLSVMTHPTAVSFDTNGNLWVGGQGALQLINTTTWSISATFPIDGTVTGMSYDMAQGGFVSTVLKNGTIASLSNGTTMNAAVAFSGAGGVSYATTSVINVATGDSVTSSIASDTAPYSQSSIASALAFPGQTAFNPPIYTSSNGDLIASANGDTFTVSLLSSGKVLVNGTTPYPIRGIKLTSTMLYLTMPESNSLVTLPIQLP
jgi:DNA-binding beta-propeller fold protein YncE